LTPLIENKVVAALLKIMRSRRTSYLSSTLERATVPERRKAAVKQREVQFTDFEAVAKLKERWGLGKDSLQNWYRLWRDNRALTFSKSPLSMGWVLEVDGEIVGYQGSVPLLYYYCGRPLLVATGTGMVVEPAYRAFSVALLASFYRQKNVDLLLITTPSESVAKLAKAFGAEALPQRDYDTVLFWVLNARHFARAVAKKFGVNGKLGGLIAVLGSSALRTQMTIFRRCPNGNSQKCRVIELQVSEIGDDFEVLWQKKLAEKGLLLADRSSVSLRWHFTVPASQRRTALLCCHFNGRLTGYAAVQNAVDRETGMRQCFLADMLVEGDDSDVIESLLRSAYEYARRSGSHIFEVLGFPANVRQIVMRWKPYYRKYPACPFFYKAKDQSLREDLLTAADHWYASPYDGDTSLIL